MEQTVITIGNSAGIIIPQKILKSVGISSGDRVLVQEKAGKITLAPTKKEIGGVDPKFMKMVDDFIESHKDVLAALSKR